MSIADRVINIAHLNRVSRESLGFEAPPTQFEREVRALKKPLPN